MKKMYARNATGVVGLKKTVRKGIAPIARVVGTCDKGPVRGLSFR